MLEVQAGPRDGEVVEKTFIDTSSKVLTCLVLKSWKLSGIKLTTDYTRQTVGVTFLLFCFNHIKTEHVSDYDKCLSVLSNTAAVEVV